jgi:hypothetical protein
LAKLPTADIEGAALVAWDAPADELNITTKPVAAASVSTRAKGLVGKIPPRRTRRFAN